jgi:3-deoxy-D-manno-octulosonic-acid transferase
LGELGDLYRLAAGCFIGGTLVPRGGHNPLEAARFGRPIAVGPSMENFRDVAAEFDRAHGWRRVGDAVQLGAAWREWLELPAAGQAVGERGLAVVEQNRGALARTLSVLTPLLANATVATAADTPDAAAAAGRTR